MIPRKNSSANQRSLLACSLAWHPPRRPPSRTLSCKLQTANCKLQTASCSILLLKGCRGLPPVPAALLLIAEVSSRPMISTHELLMVSSSLQAEPSPSPASCLHQHLEPPYVQYAPTVGTHIYPLQAKCALQEEFRTPIKRQGFDDGKSRVGNMAGLVA